jgi:hypothetical protein
MFQTLLYWCGQRDPAQSAPLLLLHISPAAVQGERRPGFVGVPLPGVEVKVLQQHDDSSTSSNNSSSSTNGNGGSSSSAKIEAAGKASSRLQLLRLRCHTCRGVTNLALPVLAWPSASVSRHTFCAG